MAVPPLHRTGGRAHGAVRMRALPLLALCWAATAVSMCTMAVGAPLRAAATQAAALSHAEIRQPVAVSKDLAFMQKPQQQLEREQQLLQQQLEQGEQRHQQQLEREQQQQQQQPQKQQHSEQSGHRHQQQQQEQQLEQQQQEASAGSVMYEFLSELPKAELHIHLEGTLEIPMMFDLAARNDLPPPYPSQEAAEAAYRFSDLQSFLDLYYRGCQVLITHRDFFDLAWAYFRKAHAQGVHHVELFFDPQTHLARNVSFSTFFPSILEAAEKARRELNLNVHLILCFLRHLPEISAFEALAHALPYLPHLTGVGLDSSETGRPPSMFSRVFAVARSLGLHAVAHAGEEGPPDYVWQALKSLKAERIDHGVRSVEDPKLIAYLESRLIGLTVCPLSNLRLQVFKSDDEARTALNRLIRGTSLVCTLNSDDPAYFGGYILENYVWVQQLLQLEVREVGQLAKNSFAASFMRPHLKQRHFEAIDSLVQQFEDRMEAALRRGAQ